MRAAALQFDVRIDDVDHNIFEVERGVRDAARQGCALVVLPEMWPTSFPDADTDIERSLDATDRALERVLALTLDADIVVCGSAFGRTSGLPTNRWHMLERGRVVASYDKVHLFTPTAEEGSFSAGGAAPASADTQAGTIGGIVCYDLRFPEVARALFHAGVDAIAVSAQWPDTRADHFEALCVGRAVESQCFVVACNRTGHALVGRRRMRLTFAGRSLIVDPNGRVIARGSETAGLVTGDIDLDLARTARVRVPVEKDERPEVYTRWQA